MWQRYKYYIFMVVAVASLWYYQANKPKPINWTESYSRFDKIPYGNYVLYSMLDDIFKRGVKASGLNITKTLSDKTDFTNYVFINNEFYPDYSDYTAILNYAYQGNNVFIAASEIDSRLLDTLQLETKNALIFRLRDTTSIKISEIKKSRKIIFGKRVSQKVFTNLKDNQKELGRVSDSLLNFVRVPFGSGMFYINLNPLAFTNIHMLKQNNHNYVSAALSYMPNEPVLWDEFYKIRNKYVTKSPLQTLHDTKGLHEAMQVLILALIVYMIFNSKRKQRIIPELDPKKNDTVDFTKTIGRLYYNIHNNKDIGLKRMEFFLWGIRKKYNLRTNTIDIKFAEKIAFATGQSLEDAKKLVNNFNVIKGVPDVSDERIKEQEKLIDKFTDNY